MELEFTKRVYRDHLNQLLHLAQRRQRPKEVPLTHPRLQSVLVTEQENGPGLIITEQNPGQLRQTDWNKASLWALRH